MKQTAEKPIEVNNDRHALNQSIDDFRMFQENYRQQNELIADLERNLGEINDEISLTQSKIDNPVYPKMRTIADIDEFLQGFGAPHKRLELLLAARNELVKQIGTAKSANSRYVDLMIDAKNNTWHKLAQLLIRPIQDELNKVLFAVGRSKNDLIQFLISENEGKDMSQLSEKLTSEYGMPK